MAGKPPLELHAEVVDAEGKTTRWAGGARSGDVPQNITFTTGVGEGFKNAAVTLSRRIDRDYVDLHLYDDLNFIGVDGTSAWEGRIASQPRSLDSSGHQIALTGVGWASHLSDSGFREVYIDRELSGWTAGPIRRRAQIYTAGIHLNADPSTKADANGQALLTAMRGAWVGQARTEAWYDAGTSLGIGSLYYQFSASGFLLPADTNWSWYGLLSTDDITTAFDITSNLNTGAATGSGTLTSTTTTKRFGVVWLNYAVAAGNAGDQYDLAWPVLAVYGNHGLTKRGSGTTGAAATAPGLYVSDVISNIVSRFAPKLSTAGVTANTFVLQNAAFKTRTKPYDAIKQVNAYSLWNLAVWENRTLYYQPYDLTDYTWEARISDPGVSVSLQGDTTEEVANRLAVVYTDVNTGRTEYLDPENFAQLRDDTIELEANRHGIRKEPDAITLGFQTDQASALAAGTAALAENNRPKAAGTITVQGHLRDRAGHWQQAWRVRAGDTISITDYPNDRPRLITETSYSAENETMTITVDGAPRQLDAVFERLSGALRTAGLG